MAINFAAILETPKNCFSRFSRFFFQNRVIFKKRKKNFKDFQGILRLSLK